MVMNIISLPGVMSPELVSQFRVAIERAGLRPLEEQVAEREALIRDMAERRSEMDSNPARPDLPPDSAPEAAAEAAPEAGPEDQAADAESVKGLRMERVDSPAEDTSLSSSGVEWTLSAFVLALLAVFFVGYRRKARRAAEAPGEGAARPFSGNGGAASGRPRPQGSAGDNGGGAAAGQSPPGSAGDDGGGAAAGQSPPGSGGDNGGGVEAGQSPPGSDGDDGGMTGAGADETKPPVTGETPDHGDGRG
jgi:hypothetical protein